MSAIDRVTCDEAFRLLDDYIDRELNSQEQQLVEAHLKVCAPCAQRFHFEASVLQQVREKVQKTHAPADLMDRVVKRIRENE